MQKKVLSTLYIVTAPSGAGKTSLVNALVETTRDLIVSVSYTTRPRRISEIADVAYHFIDGQVFDDMVEQNLFLEHATVFTYQYGTSREWVEEKLASGLDVILEIDWQGAAQVRLQMPQAVTIFILPPSIEVLRERLCKRAQDNPTVIQRRVAEAKKEISHCQEFDYLVVNDDFSVALQDLKTIIEAERLRGARQSQHQAQLIQALLNES